jgi:U3 small nucleolar RNA-associated protein MPP10
MSSSSRSSSPEAVELPEQLLSLAKLIEAKPESFASGDKDIENAALSATKYLFERGQESIPEIFEELF